MKLSSILSDSKRKIVIYPGNFESFVYEVGSDNFSHSKSALTVSKKNSLVIAKGDSAWEMKERLPKSANYLNPFSSGKVDDLNFAVALLSDLIEKSGIKLNPLKPKPTIAYLLEDASQLNKELVRDLNRRLGFTSLSIDDFNGFLGKVCLSHKEKKGACLLVNIYLDKAEICVVTSTTVILKKRIPIGILSMLGRLNSYLVNTFSLATGEMTRLKLLGQLGESEVGKYFVARGKSLEDGFPRSIRLESQSVFEEISAELIPIVKAINSAIKTSQAEVSTDISKNGLFLFSDLRIAQFSQKFLSSQFDFPVSLVELNLHRISKAFE